MALNRQLPKGAIGNVHMLHTPIIPEPEVAIYTMATQFHGQEHSCITPPAVLMAGVVIGDHSTMERPARHRYSYAGLSAVWTSPRAT